jgi:hypothetical protein
MCSSSESPANARQPTVDSHAEDSQASSSLSSDPGSPIVVPRDPGGCVGWNAQGQKMEGNDAVWSLCTYAIFVFGRRCYEYL